MFTIRPRALGPHVRQDELGEVRQAEEVHLELVAGLVDGDLLDRPVEAEAGVVDEDVDPALVRDDPVHDPFVVLGCRDVHPDGGDAVVGEVGHALQAPGSGVHGVALLTQQDRGLPAHARRCPGDQYDLAHRITPCGWT